MSRARFPELDRISAEQSRITQKLLYAPLFYNRITDGETDSPKQLLSELFALQSDLEQSGPEQFWRLRSQVVFSKHKCLKNQADEQNEQTDPALLLIADEIEDIKEAAKLIRAIKKRATALRKAKREADGY